MKWKIKASLVSISITNGSDEQVSDYKLTFVNPCIVESSVDTIFIEAAYYWWSEGDRNEKADSVVISSPPVPTTSSP